MRPLLLLILALTTSAYGAGTQRYLVATRPEAGTAAMQGRDRNLVRFESFRGFAANLTSDEAASLRNSHEVRWVEPIVTRRAFGIERNLAGQTRPYGLEAVKAPAAWTALRRDVVNVVVIDTGVSADHPDLSGVVAGAVTFVGGSPDDVSGHGTHVAGTIAAADNGLGVVGVSPAVRLWSARVLASNGLGTNENIIKAIDWTVEQKRALGGNWVINLSLGDTTDSPGEHEAIRNAVDEGILIVAASGNSVEYPVAYPAAYPEVIAVGATDAALEIADFSSRGPEIDLTAPGVNVLSTYPANSGRLFYLVDGFDLRDITPLAGSGSGVATADYIFCGLGFPSDFPPEIAGRIALLERGEIRFADKARAAKDAGAVAVAIYDNTDGSGNRATWTLTPDGENPDGYDFPLTVSLSKEDGEALRQRSSGSITIRNAPDDYRYRTGTSMAAPHVTGAAALLWAIAPSATASQVLQALIMTAVDRGEPGHDPVFGAGVIDIYAAARWLAPEAFGRSGRPFVRRGGG